MYIVSFRVMTDVIGGQTDKSYITGEKWKEQVINEEVKVSDVIICFKESLMLYGTRAGRVIRRKI